MGLEISESAAKLHSHRIRFILSYRILLQTFPPQFCMFSALKMKEINIIWRSFIEPSVIVINYQS